MCLIGLPSALITGRDGADIYTSGSFGCGPHPYHNCIARIDVASGERTALWPQQREGALPAGHPEEEHGERHEQQQRPGRTRGHPVGGIRTDQPAVVLRMGWGTGWRGGRRSP